MKTFLATLFLAASTAVFAQQAPPNPNPQMMPMMHPPETVSVTGTGRVALTPDRFTFNVGVQTMSATVDDAVAENNRRVAAVIAALKKAGARDEDIQTSGFNLYPQQDYQQNQMPRIVGYQATNSVTVRSEKVADAGRLLGIAIAAGVNTSSGLQFEVSDPARGREQGLRAAFDDARARANALAQAAGRTLGRALSISEGSQAAPPPPYPVRAMAMKAQAAQVDVPVEAGTQENGYTVSVVFELR
ncbi:MAG: SIMPL domain-containing protein [Acidobacteria bacterium]|nr:SIMPL domain-containing protein [Acidobacteriota bacterium]MBV9478680.1 SIMPL domain-containing protein [Acidobacteriota bacterium]